MAEISFMLEELGKISYSELLQKFQITDKQAYDSEISGDSDADDGFPLRTPSAPKAKGTKRKVSEEGNQSSSSAGSSTESGSATSGDDFDEEEDQMDDHCDEPTMTPRIILQEAEACISSGEEESAEDIYKPKWKKGQGSRIGSKFASSKFNEPFGSKVEINRKNFPQIFYHFFFNNSFIQHIVEQSNLYASQRGHNLALSSNELCAFLGMLIIMGFHTLPNFFVLRIAQIMPIRRFLKITRFLHLNDNSKMPPRGTKDFDRV